MSVFSYVAHFLLVSAPNGPHSLGERFELEVGTFLGGILGTSSVTTYGESMAGVYEGGRTGLTALVIAFLNFPLHLLDAPLLSHSNSLNRPSLGHGGCVHDRGREGHRMG